MKQEEG